MTDHAYLRRLEERLVVLRFVGFFALVATTVWGTYPKEGFHGYNLTIAQLGIAPLLLAGTVAIFFANRAHLSERARARLSFGAFAFDALVVLSCTSLLGIDPPMWSDTSGPRLLIGYDVSLGPLSLITLLIPIEGGLRYRIRGALSSATFTAIFLGTCLWWGVQTGALGVNLSFYLLIVGLALGFGFIVGGAAQMWQETQVASELSATRLIELDHLRDRYVAITSHEIRGPLTAIITGVETIRRRGDYFDEAGLDRMLGMISQQGKQLARLVDDLMISSELEAGKLAIQPEMVELEPTVQRSLEGAAPKRRAHQLEVFIEPLQCEIDPYRIAQMLRNLLENAYKYTPDRTRVTVSGRAVEGGIELEVSDSGPGIPLDRRDQLFEAFSRMEETAAGKEGVGLGLYVVSQLATAMEARIDLASSSRGTTFTIRIPCRVEPLEHRRMGIISSEEQLEEG